MINIMTYPDIPAGTRLIQSDRADILLSDLAMVDQLSCEQPDGLRAGFQGDQRFQDRGRHEEGQRGSSQGTGHALTVLQADGTQKKIYEEYKLDPALMLPIAIQR